jgi:hypothetical protein
MDLPQKAGKTQLLENTEKTKVHILKLLGEGKFHISALGRKIRDGNNFNVVLEEVRLAKGKWLKAMRQAGVYGSRAEKYVQKNPKKAVALAAGAGLLAGILGAFLTVKKPVTAGKKRAPRPAAKSRPIRP